ncbi:hypothetical protein MIND_00248900 [Mycena indigotica]|uniref:Uncharacterized protein n=1 Tax=Mycena indigotica TaxID=2126181 RepID=A0A8H6T5W3_9AGAR|nr:uncharacterized protein MIND_00248900 [Mycena indigotica]KAF7312358.1 hypothetical protein MIND_00248900 [Mycena indigotica]
MNHQPDKVLNAVASMQTEAEAFSVRLQQLKEDRDHPARLANITMLDEAIATDKKEEDGIHAYIALHFPQHLTRTTLAGPSKHALEPDGEEEAETAARPTKKKKFGKVVVVPSTMMRRSSRSKSRYTGA